MEEKSFIGFERKRARFSSCTKGQVKRIPSLKCVPYIVVSISAEHYMLWFCTAFHDRSPYLRPVFALFPARKRTEPYLLMRRRWDINPTMKRPTKSPKSEIPQISLTPETAQLILDGVIFELLIFGLVRFVQPIVEKLDIKPL